MFIFPYQSQIPVLYLFVSLLGAEHNCVDSLAFETGIPKSIIQRYSSLLSEHRRIILSGPTGTGKSHLAQHLAAHLLSRYVTKSTSNNPTLLTVKYVR